MRKYFLNNINKMIFYKGYNNEWYNRDLSIEKSLVLNYEIQPSQVKIGINFFTFWLILFKDKWNSKFKFLIIKQNEQV